jgi:hypothetical protein
VNAMPVGSNACLRPAGVVAHSFAPSPKAGFIRGRSPQQSGPGRDLQANCTATTYWIWDSNTDKQVVQLTNNSNLCFSLPYNIEARPCATPKIMPVKLAITNATLTVLGRGNEYYSPYFLWGDNPQSGDVFKNKKPLPAATYWLYTTIDGATERIKFTKTC